MEALTLMAIAAEKAAKFKDMQNIMKIIIQKKMMKVPKPTSINSDKNEDKTFKLTFEERTLFSVAFNTELQKKRD